MSRLEEVEALLAHTADAGWPSADEAAEYRHLSLTLAAEVDELRAELKVVREGKTELNGIMEAMTKGANEADIITKLLALLKPGPEPDRQLTNIPNHTDSDLIWSEWHRQADLYARACEIAGRAE